MSASESEAAPDGLSAPSPASAPASRESQSKEAEKEGAEEKETTEVSNMSEYLSSSKSKSLTKSARRLFSRAAWSISSVDLRRWSRRPSLGQSRPPVGPKLSCLQQIRCLIRALDDSLLHELLVYHYDTGSNLMSSLNEALSVADAKFLGLKIADSLATQETLESPVSSPSVSLARVKSRH